MRALSPEMIKSAFKATVHSINLSSTGSFSTIFFWRIPCCIGGLEEVFRAIDNRLRVYPPFFWRVVFGKRVCCEEKCKPIIGLWWLMESYGLSRDTTSRY